MLTDKKIKIFRFLGHAALVFLIILVSTLIALIVLRKAGELETIVGGVMILLGVIAMFYFHKKVDGWQSDFILQTDFAQDKAFLSLFDKSPVAYVIIQVNGTITNSNPAAAHMLKREIKEMRGVNFFNLIQTDSTTDAGVLQGKIQIGLTINDVEVILDTASGETVWAMLSVYAYQHDGQRLISLVDITDKKHVDTAKSEFVALATHQLRTPIAAIRWNVELLKNNLKNTVTPDQERYLTKVERNVHRMIDLINDFLSVSKLEMGTFAAEEEDINLAEFFTGIVDEYAEKFTEKEIVLNRRDYPPQAVIKTDSRLFHIIVSNLVSNAVKYLRPKGALELSYELRGESLKIIVADNGIGIPSTEIPNLFTKFFRASNAQSHQTQGTGLGLYVVKQSVELLGGKIEVESEENQGARFVATIPARVVSVSEIG